MSAIEIAELQKAIDGREILRGLTLQVPEGHVYGLVGPSASGKTTLIHLLLGFLRRDSGVLRVLGTDDPQRVRRKIGYLPQGQRYHARFTPREYLRFLGQCGGLSGSPLESRIGEELRAVGLVDVADMPNESLSRPQIQRLSIAQALLTHPALLLLDEPIIGTDSPGDQGLLDLLASLRERGQTILVATQRLEHAEFLCDTIGVLAQGRVAAEAEARSLRGPGRNVLITVLQLPSAVADHLRTLSPAVTCEGNEIALQPNTPDLQAQVLSGLIRADVMILALEPFGRPIEELYHRALQGLPVNDSAASPAPDASATPPPAVPGRPGTGDTLLRELLKNKDQQ